LVKRKQIRKKAPVSSFRRTSAAAPESTFRPKQLLLVLFGPFVLAMLFVIWTRWSVRNDVTDAEERHGIGTVSDIQTLAGSRRQGNVMLTIEMNGKTSLFRPYAWDESTFLDYRPGKLVSVDYKLGRSGTVYIDRVVPADASKSDGPTAGGL